MRTLGKGTIGHGIKGVFDNIFFGLSYFVHIFVYTRVLNHNEDNVLQALNSVGIFMGIYIVLGLVLSFFYVRMMASILVENEKFYQMKMKRTRELTESFLRENSEELYKFPPEEKNYRFPGPNQSQEIDITKATDDSDRKCDIKKRSSNGDYIEKLEKNSVIAKITCNHFNSINLTLTLIRFTFPGLLNAFMSLAPTLLQNKFKMSPTLSNYLLAFMTVAEAFLNILVA